MESWAIFEKLEEIQGGISKRSVSGGGNYYFKTK